MRIMIYVLVLIALSSIAYSETKQASIGDTVVFTSKLKNLENENLIKGDILLSDYTVFYPISVLIENEKCILEQVKLEEWHFSKSITNNQSDSLTLSVVGIVAAGRNNRCDVIIDNFRIGDVALEDVNFQLIVDRVGFSNNYIRFPQFINMYPHPLKWDRSSEIEFAIDKVSDIKYQIFDFDGKLLKEETLFNQPFGVQKYQYTPDYDISAGVYLLYIDTNSGRIIRRFIIE